MNLFLHYMQMVMPGSSYWSIGIGRDIGEVLKDEEGLQTMKTLGQNMAWLLKKVTDPKKKTR
jgi:multimeric flavodoxin WrbA